MAVLDQRAFGGEAPPNSELDGRDPSNVQHLKRKNFGIISLLGELRRKFFPPNVLERRGK